MVTGNFSVLHWRLHAVLQHLARQAATAGTGVLDLARQMVEPGCKPHLGELPGATVGTAASIVVAAASAGPDTDVIGVTTAAGARITPGTSRGVVVGTAAGAGARARLWPLARGRARTLKLALAQAQEQEQRSVKGRSRLQAQELELEQV